MSAPPMLDLQAVADACRKFGARGLELFGSAVRDPVAANDFDFVADIAEEEPGLYAKEYFGLYEALRRITGKPVDFVAPEGMTNRTSAPASSEASN